MLKEVLSSVKVLNSRFVDNIKDLYINKAYKKSYPVIYIYNNKYKNLILI